MKLFPLNGKRPAIRNWQNGAPGYVPKPGEAYGIATGDGLVVIDLDSHDAAQHFSNLGPVPPTFTVRTGRDEPAHHLYFKYPTTLTIKNDIGRKLGHLKIDVRAQGGYVVGPNSPHVDTGRIYTVVDQTPPADAPAWLLEKLQMDASERRAASAYAPTPIDANHSQWEYRLRRAVDFLEGEAPAAVQGENGSGSLWMVAQTLVRSFELPLDIAQDAIEELYNPRCQPAWSSKEIQHKLEDARDRGSWDCGIANEGWAERFHKAANAPTPAPRISANRKQRNPNHEYLFTPGDRPNGEKKKITYASAVADLCTHPEWEGVLQTDEFRQRIVAINPPMRMDVENMNRGLTDRDASLIAAWFEVRSTSLIGIDTAYKAAVAAASQSLFHPIKDYLDSVGARKTGILDTLATRALGATGPMANEFLKRTLIGAVQRIRQPGCQMDTTLVLTGKQGIKKTTFVRTLFGDEFTRSQIPNLASKDASQALNGFWAIELAELAGLINAPHSTVREFLTRTFDDYRPPYGRVEERFPRQCVFIGTTNDEEFLTDPTGNRRYLPIECLSIDIGYIEAHRNEIWAEVNALVAENYPHWFDESEMPVHEARESAVMKDPWEEDISEYLEGRTKVTNREIYQQAIAKNDPDISKYTRSIQIHIGNVLRTLGCARRRTSQFAFWTVPDDLKNMPCRTKDPRKALSAKKEKVMLS